MQVVTLAIYSNYNKYGVIKDDQVDLVEQFKQKADILIFCKDPTITSDDYNIKSLLSKNGKYIEMDIQDFMVPSKSALGLKYAIDNLIKVLKND